MLRISKSFSKDRKKWCLTCLIDKNSKITYKGFSSRTWCGDIMKSDEEMMVGDSLVLDQDIYKSNPDCAENAHTDVSACGEWFRADLAQ